MPCTTTTISTYYAARSALYITTSGKFYVCDETLDRTSSECYLSSDAASNDWEVLPKIVSTVVFWILDNDYTKEYLYGVGYDKVSYVRSDDGGLNWKAISPEEFTTVIFKCLSKISN